MKRYLAIIFMLAAALTLSSCGGNTGKTLIGDESKEPTYTISAGGLELKYPKKWQSKVTVTTEEDRVCFSCGETKLFDLTFNTEEGYVLGTVKGEEYTVIRVIDYLFESGNEELSAMQEDVNVLLNHLAKDYDFEVGVALEREDTSVFDIETPLVTLKYPAKWQDTVQTEVSEDGVRFSTEGTPLFDLLFTECDGFLLGLYRDTPIYIVEHPTNTDEQSDMIDDVNVILQHLMEDSYFVISG